MPAGVPWSQYLKFMSSALISMMAGSHLVHIYYKPLQDLDLYIAQEMKRNKTNEDLKPNTKT